MKLKQTKMVHHVVFALLAGLCLLEGAGTLPSTSKRELQTSNAEERSLKILNSAKMKTFAESKGATAGLVVGNSLAAIGSIVTTDFSKMPPVEAFKKIGTALVPAIAEGLAFIPVWGPIISGIFSGIWGLCSSFFGEPQKSPLEKLADHMEKEFQNIRKEMGKMKTEVLQEAAKNTEKRLGKLMATIISAEMSRNRYICDKYAAASEDMTKVLKQTPKQNVSENLRLEILMYIHDCDNFLKDTSEAFIPHIQYADVLWIPAVVTTLARVSFLAEVINHGQILRLKHRVLEPLWQEMKADIKRQLQFYGKYVSKRIDTLPPKEDLHQLTNLTKEEFTACEMQQSMLYVDIDLYQYGLPTKQIIHEDNSRLDLNQIVSAKQNGSSSSDPVHVQIFYHHPNAEPDKYLDFINCFMGPVLARAPRSSLTVVITFVTNRSYMLRVLYMTNNDGIKLKIEKKAQNNVNIVMESGKPDVGLDRHVYPTQYFHTDCKNLKYIFQSMGGNRLPGEPIQTPFHKECPVRADTYIGKFVIQNVAPFAVLPEKGESKSEGKITIVSKTKLEAIIGFELVVLPLL